MTDPITIARAQVAIENGLIEALQSQTQADMDGTTVIVSRQACDEAAEFLPALYDEVKRLRAALDDIAAAAFWIANEIHIGPDDEGRDIYEMVLAIHATEPRHPRQAAGAFGRRQMTHTNEDLLTLAERLDGIEIYSVREHLVGFGTRPIEAANNAVCEAAAALRAIVAERQAVRDRALDDAAQAVSNRAAYWWNEATAADDTGRKKLSLIYEAKALACTELAEAIRAMKGKPQMTPAERIAALIRETGTDDIETTNLAPEKMT